ncbi:MAG: MarR family transcriptional regulator, partial [Bacilli bacterium]
TNVANRLLVTIGTLSIAINRLVKKGYVIREQSHNDRRKIFVKLTQDGIRVKQIHDQFHQEMIDHVIGHMDITEQSELFFALENLQIFFREKYYQEIEFRNEK